MANQFNETLNNLMMILMQKDEKEKDRAASKEYRDAYIKQMNLAQAERERKNKVAEDYVNKMTELFANKEAPRAIKEAQKEATRLRNIEPEKKEQALSAAQAMLGAKELPTGFIENLFSGVTKPYGKLKDLVQQSQNTKGLVELLTPKSKEQSVLEALGVTGIPQKSYQELAGDTRQKRVGLSQLTEQRKLLEDAVASQGQSDLYEKLRMLSEFYKMQSGGTGSPSFGNFQPPSL